MREAIAKCTKAINIKDDIIIHGKDEEHDRNLEETFKALQSRNLTLRLTKCFLGKPEVKWFGNIYSSKGMSPDPEKCMVIKNWPEPKSCAEVKSFLQTVQFHSKFLQGKPGEMSYPEITKPLRELTKKGSKFKWEKEQKHSFHTLKFRLCSDDVLAPYDTNLPTRLYVDSSPIGTHAMAAQNHGKEQVEEIWRPVNHTSRMETS